jgi:sec-independent protein translocase protein TatA
MILAEIIGWEFFLVIGVIVLLFGGSQLPRLARSLGSAKNQFEQGLKEGEAEAPDDKSKHGPSPDDKVTMSRSELEAMLAERDKPRGQQQNPPVT